MTVRFSSRTPQQALAALLAQHAPQSLLLVGASELPAIEAFLAAHPQCTYAQAPAGALPADLAAQRFDARGLRQQCCAHAVVQRHAGRRRHAQGLHIVWKRN